MKRNGINILLIIGFTILLSACSLGGSGGKDSLSISVDPVFLELYEYLGGEDTLGKPITFLYQEGAVSYQYTENCLMRLNPAPSASQRLDLYPIAIDLNIHQPPPGDYYPQADDLIIDGYAIHPAFVNLYQTLMGEQYAGKPLTGPINNLEENRIEQYFENVGFYMILDDPLMEAKLFPYGTFSCDEMCQSIHNSQEDPAANLPEPFSKAVRDLGEDFLGQVLSAPYVLSDGSTEMIFENLVLFSEAGSSKYQSRSIVGLLGYLATVPTSEIENQYLVFVEIENGLGHNIPLFIYEYIEEHGGIEISGLPISEFTPLGDNISRQCFTNLCIEFHEDAPEPLQVVPSMLGRKYQLLVFGDSSDIPSDLQLNDSSTSDLPAVLSAEQLPAPLSGIKNPMIATSETYALISTEEYQNIYVTIYDDSIPLEAAIPYIEIFFPDETSVIYLLKATNADGQTAIQLPQIKEDSGSLIQYQVCLNLEDEDPLCVMKNFLIWNP